MYVYPFNNSSGFRMFILLLILTAMASGQVVRADEPVTLINAFRVKSPHGELNVVQVKYEFSGRRHVVTNSHGILSAKGTLQFLTDANEIEFRDPNSKELLGAVKIKENIKLMGRKEVPIPRLSDFPTTSQTGTWKQKQPFGDNLIKVLNRHFPNGYLPIQKGKDRIFITNFKLLEDLANSKQKARVATMVKVPSSVALDKPVRFRVFFLAQERRSRTEWRAAESEDVVKHIHNFVSRLTKELAVTKRSD